MSKIELINGSCADQEVDAVVNAANRNLWSGGGICGIIFKKAGYAELNEECKKHNTPLKDGEAVITSSCNMNNCKYIIHAVGPDFGHTPNAFKELYNAYYNSLIVLNKILSSDPIEISDRRFSLCTRVPNQTVIATTIIENDRTDDEFDFHDEPILIERDMQLPPNLPKGTEIFYVLNRDR